MKNNLASKLTVLFVACLAFIMLFALCASADEINQNFETPELYCRAELAKSNNADKLLYIYDQIVKGVESCSTIVLNSSEFEVTLDEFMTVNSAYRCDYAEHFWLGTSLSYSYYQKGGVVYLTKVNPQYLMTSQTLELAKAQFESAVAEILSGITPSMSEYERELLIHDRLAERIYYPVIGVDYDMNNPKNEHNAYGALVEGRAVCEGYAEAFQYLLRKVGIQSVLVIGSSRGIGHEWNIVRIDGKYYQVDLTWDDPFEPTANYPADKTDTDTRIYHSYLNVTDAIILEDHVMDATQGYSLPVCNSDDAFYFKVEGGAITSLNVQSLADAYDRDSGVINFYVGAPLTYNDVSAFLFGNGNANLYAIGDAIGLVNGWGCTFSALGREYILTITCAHMGYLTRVPSKQPSCELDGNTEYYLCSCGRFFSDRNAQNAITDKNSVKIPSLGHDFKNEYLNDADAHWHKCSRCSKTSEHEPHTPNVANASAGVDKICTACNYVIEKAPAVHVHNLTKVGAKTPDCLNGGNIEYYTCACGKWFADKNAVNEITDKESVKLSAKGHDHTEKILDAAHLKSKATDCRSADEYWFDCSRCDNISSEKFFTSENKGEHKFESTYKNDSVNHWHKCEYCDATTTHEKHTPNVENATEQTAKFCTVCDYVIEEKLSHVHNLTKVNAKTPDCLNGGNIEYYTCACGKWFADKNAVNEITDKESVKLSAKGHDHTEKILDAAHLKSKATDCRSADEYWFDCSRCDNISNEKFFTSEIKGEHKFESAYKNDSVNHWHKCEYCDATTAHEKHTPNVENATEQTAKFCTVCDYVIEEKLSHVHVLTKVNAKTPDCLNGGNIEYYTCACGKWFSDKNAQNEITEKDSVKIAALGHDHTEKILNAAHLKSKATDCRSADEYWFDCSRCDNISNEKFFTSENKGEHKFESAYKNDSVNHWHKCEYCDATTAHEKHIPNIENATEQTAKFCTVCDYVIEEKLSHVHVLTKVNAKTPDCLNGGNIEYYTCACGKWFSDKNATNEITDKDSVKIAASGHDHTEKILDAAHLKSKATDCRSADEYWFDCSRCDNISNEKFFTSENKGEHKFESTYKNDSVNHWHKCEYCDATDSVAKHTPNIENATEQTAKFCTVCDYVIEEKLSHVHNLTKVNAKTPDCLNGGNIEYYTCACGKWFADKNAVNEITDKDSVKIAASGHDHTEKILDAAHLKSKATDCRSADEYWFDCSRCDNISNEKFFTSENKGEHKFESAYKNDSVNHWHKCEYCDATTAHEKHTSNVENATEQTAKFCTVCDYVIEEKLSHVHNLTKVGAKTPDCLNGGNIEYYTCACGKWFSDKNATNEITDKNSVKIAALGHDHAEKILNAAHLKSKATDCRSADEYWFDCSRCDNVSNEKFFTSENKGEHKFETSYKNDSVNHWHKCEYCDATTTHEKHTPNIENATEQTAKFCTVCDYVIEEKLSHVHNLTKVGAKTPDCLNGGNIEYYTCACGKWFSDKNAQNEITDKDSVKIAALGHEWSEKCEDESHLKSSASDCRYCNEYWFDCKNCDAISTELFFAGSLHGSHVFKEEWASGTPEGNWHECKYCNEHTELTPHVPNIDHATESQDKVCSNCGYLIEAAHPSVTTPTDTTSSVPESTTVPSETTTYLPADTTVPAESTPKSDVTTKVPDETEQTSEKVTSSVTEPDVSTPKDSTASQTEPKKNGCTLFSPIGAIIALAVSTLGCALIKKK